MFVRGRIPLATRLDAILIPDEAVTTDQARKVVYVVGPDNRVTVRPVELGPISEGLRVVDKGLRRTTASSSGGFCGCSRGPSSIRNRAKIKPNQPHRIPTTKPTAGD